MEDVVGIKAKDHAGRAVAFMVWGRLFDPVNDRELLDVVKSRSSSFEGTPMTDFELCSSLSDLADHEYFYEALLHFAWQPIPFGEDYKAWRQERRVALTENGKDLFFLGRIRARTTRGHRQ